MKLSVIIALIFMLSNISGCQRLNQYTANQNNKIIDKNSGLPIEKQESISYFYDAANVKIGDVIGGMKVAEVYNYINDESSEYGILYAIVFEGEFEITGSICNCDGYRIHNDDIISSVLPYSSLEKEIEDRKEEKMGVSFFVEDWEALEMKIKDFINDDDGDKHNLIKIRARFKNYSFFLYEYSYEHYADFVELIEIIDDN